LIVVSFMMFSPSATQGPDNDRENGDRGGQHIGSLP